MADRPHRGCPRLASCDAILDAVREIGLDAATAMAVAARVGVDQSTLHRHIGGVEDMLDAAAAVATTRGEWPEPDLREAALIVDTIGDMPADSYLAVEALHRPADGGGSYSEQVLRRMADAGEALGAPVVSGEYLEAMRYTMGKPDAPSSWWLDKVDLAIDGVQLRLNRRAS